jgi:hypothetical protein
MEPTARALQSAVKMVRKLGADDAQKAKDRLQWIRSRAAKSNTALRLIREWALLHRSELEANWASMKAGRPLDKISPLE